MEPSSVLGSTGHAVTGPERQVRIPPTLLASPSCHIRDPTLHASRLLSWASLPKSLAVETPIHSLRPVLLCIDYTICLLPVWFALLALSRPSASPVLSRIVRPSICASRIVCFVVRVTT